jgi:eukaryotic-like serine/threonine-protein kinase
MAALVLLGGTVLAPNLGQRIENAVYDRAMRLNTAAPTENVAFVAIDQASTARLGAWPWPRSVHAQLVDKLRDAGAGTIAFAFPMHESQKSVGLDNLRAALDLLQSNDSANSAHNEQLRKLLDSSVADLDEDSALAEAISRHGNVLLPIEVILGGDGNNVVTANTTEFNERAYVVASPEALRSGPAASEINWPAAKLASAARGLGHIAILTEPDQVVRSDLVGVRNGDRLIPSLALALRAAVHGVEVSKITFPNDQQITFGERQFLLDDGLQMRGTVFPAKGQRAVNRYSYWQVLAGEITAEELRGRSIVVGLDTGTTAPTLNTPLAEPQSAASLIASFAASFVGNRTYREPLWGIAVKWLVGASVMALSIWVLPQVGVLVATVIALVLGSLFVFAEVGLLNMIGAWVQLSLPACALIAATIGTGGARATFRLAGPRLSTNDPVGSLRTLGLTFQNQGQLDLAYETFRRCPADGESLELIYGLGQDYERRRQFGKAAEVYGYIASMNATFKDVQARRERMKRSELALNSATKPGAKQASSGHKDAAATPLRAVPPPKSASGSGRQSLGRYEIERELGKGAMGVVYLGRDPKINRVVAIKAIALAEEFAEDDLADARARFFREAEMAGRLNHPGIVTVYDAGEDRGLAYIAMEYLRGEHLSNYTDPSHLLPAAKTLALMARVADALDYAHKQNVVHRDIKPANIMFNADTDELKITDFGIARLTDTSRTKTGIVLGTPSFMSPEQLEGRPLDGRSDLFALGIALYQLLTGQLPFRADSMTRLMHKIAIEPHVPLLSLRPELPDMAEQIIARALAKSAHDRYQTGAEIAVALRGCIRLVLRKDALAR